MKGLFQNRFRRSSHGRRRSRGVSLAMSLERLEPRLALAGDVSRPLLEATTRLYMDPSMHGPQPVVMSKSQVVGHDVKSFVISRVPEGSVVEKLDTATNTWVDVSTKPTSSNPRELLRLLQNRLIQQGDSLRWTPTAGTASSVQQAFEMIGWDDRSQPRPRPQGVPQAVQNIVATFDSLGDLVVTWDALSSGEASEDIRYTVTMTTTTAAGSSTQRHVTASTSAVYPGLSPRNVHSFSVTASNTVGTGDGSQSIDGPPRVAYLGDTGISSTDNLTSDRTPTLTGRVLGDASHVRVVIEGDSSDLIPIVDGTWTYTVPATAPLADGDYSFFAVPINTLGEAGAPSQAREFTVSAQRPATPTFGLADDTDTGIKGDGQTILEQVSINGFTDPDKIVRVSIDGVPVVLAKSDSTTGAWQCPLPKLFSGSFDITAVAISPSGVVSPTATLKLTISGVRTVMLGAASGQPIELTPYHILGNQTPGFIVTKVHEGVLEKSVDGSNWNSIPPGEVEVTLAALQSPESARAVGFAERVRWSPSLETQGTRAAFDVIPLDVLGGTIAPLPEVETVPGKLVNPAVAYQEESGATLSWSDPVDGLESDSTRYSVRVTQADGRTLLYNVDSSVHEIAIPDSGKLRSALFWSAISAGASGRFSYSAKLEQQLQNRLEFSVLSQISAANLEQQARMQLDSSPTPVVGQQHGFVLGKTHESLAYLEVKAVPDEEEAAQGLEAGTFPVVSFDSNKLTSGQLASLKENPILAKEMFPGTVEGEVQPDQVRVHFQAGEELEIAGNVDPSIRDRATIIVEETEVLAGNKLGIWRPVANVDIGADGAYSYLHKVRYGQTSVRVRLELTDVAPDPSPQMTTFTATQDTSTQQAVISTPIDLNYNKFGITTEGWSVPDQQGFDGHGNYYSSGWTSDSTYGRDTAVLNYAQLEFPIGPIPVEGSQANNNGRNNSSQNTFNYLQANGQVASYGQVIDVDVPAADEGWNSVLYLAGAGKNGDQLSQQITLEFIEADGSTTQEIWTQSFTDWANNGDSSPPTTYRGEHLIKKNSERINQVGNYAKGIPAYLFAYGYALANRQLKSITLPNNQDIGIVSAIVATAPKIFEREVQSYVLGHMNLTGVDMVALTLINESNVGAGGSALEFFLADQPNDESVYTSKSVTVPMGEHRTIAYVGTNAASVLAFTMQKASNVVGGTASTYIPQWSRGKSNNPQKYAANITPSLNGRIAPGQHWTLTIQNAGAGFWGWIDRPSARHGLWEGGLPYGSGKKNPPGAEFKMLTQAEIDLGDQPEWAKVLEKVAGFAVITVATMGVGIALAPAEATAAAAGIAEADSVVTEAEVDESVVTQTQNDVGWAYEHNRARAFSLDLDLSGISEADDMWDFPVEEEEKEFLASDDGSLIVQVSQDEEQLEEDEAVVRSDAKAVVVDVDYEAMAILRGLGMEEDFFLEDMVWESGVSSEVVGIDLAEDAIDRLEISFESALAPAEIPPALQDSFVSLEDVLGGQVQSDVELYAGDTPWIADVSYDDMEAIDQALYDEEQNVFKDGFEYVQLSPFSEEDWEFAQEQFAGFFDLSNSFDLSN